MNYNLARSRDATLRRPSHFLIASVLCITTFAQLSWPFIWSAELSCHYSLVFDQRQRLKFKDVLFLVACYATLHPTLSVRRLVCRSIGHTLLFWVIEDFDLSTTRDLNYSPCQTAPKWGGRVSGLVMSISVFKKLRTSLKRIMTLATVILS